MRDRQHPYYASIVVTLGLSAVALGLLLLLLGWPAAPVRAATVVVDRATGSDGPTCGSASAPCRSISYAVAQIAASGDVISVLPGIYTETVTLMPGVIIAGAGPSVTFIDGEDVRGPMVTAGNGVTGSAGLRGLTIRRGNSATHGGGLLITGGASPTIEDCVIGESQAASNGGGAYIQASSPVFSNTQVLSNTAVRGGGIYLAGAAYPIHDDVSVAYNRATGLAYGDGGGGLYVEDSLTLTGTRFISNTASASGGGIYQLSESGRLALVGGRLERNTAVTLDGGGVYLRGSLALTNTLVLSNTAAKWGGGLYVNHSVTMAGVQVIDNVAGQWGGGLYQNLFTERVSISGGRFGNNKLTWANSIGGALCSSSPLTMVGTEVIGNYANEGGGIHGSSSITLTGVNVISNTAVTHGGGLNQNGPGGDDADFWAYVVDSRFEDNVTLNGSGGAIHVAGNAALTQTQVISNSAAASGGGMYVEYDLLMNETDVLSNTARKEGGGVYQYSGGHQVVGIGGRIAHNVATAGGGGGLYTSGTLNLSETKVLTNTCSQWGGGLFVAGASPGANLEAVDLVGNRAGQSGGGLYFAAANALATVNGGRWERNVAEAFYDGWDGGGGAYAWGSIALTATKVMSNATAGIGGGGLYAQRGARVVNALFFGNTATNGAALHLRGAEGDQALAHLTVRSGTTLGSGSAIYIYKGTATITNTIIVSHSTGVFAASGAAASVNGVLWFGNTAHTGGAGTVTVAQGYTGEPAFAADGYHLTAASPAIDRGVDSGIAVDIDGDERPQNGLYDLGADEYVPGTFLITPSAGPGGVITPDMPQTVDYGDDLSFTIAPDPGYHILDVTVDGVSLGPLSSYTFVSVAADHTITATFLIGQPIYYTLTMQLSGSGVTTPEAGTHTYLSGTEVELSATPASGWQFSGWSGAEVLQSPTRVLMDDHKTLTATFTQMPVNQAPTADAGADQIVAPGAMVTLDGSASSDPDGHLPLSYLWRQTGGIPVTFTPTLSRSTFIAPQTPTILTYTLTVTDSLGLVATTPDTVVITVRSYRIYMPLIQQSARRAPVAMSVRDARNSR